MTNFVTLVRTMQIRKIVVALSSPLIIVGCGSSSDQDTISSELPNLTIIQSTVESHPKLNGSATEIDQSELGSAQKSNIDWSSYLGYWYSADSKPQANNEVSTDASDASSSNEVQVVSNGSPSQNNNADSPSADTLFVNDVHLPAQLSSAEKPIHLGQQLTIVVTDSQVSSVHNSVSVRGPIDAINTEDSLSVMGQIVTISTSTQFNDAFNSSPAVGDIVEVSGIRDANQKIYATLVKKKNESAANYSVRGLISDHDVNGDTFKIGSLTVDYQQIKANHQELTKIKDGQLVEVSTRSGHYEPGSYYILANGVNMYENGFIVSQDSSLSVNTSGNLSLTHDAHSVGSSSTWVEYDAYITKILSDTRFIAGTVEVQLLATTKFEGGSRDDLSLNRLVEINGKKLSSGIVHAWKIEFEEQDIYLSNASSAYDASVSVPLSTSVTGGDDGVVTSSDSNSEESEVPTIQESSAVSVSNSVAEETENVNSTTSTEDIDWESYLGYWYNGTASSDSNSADSNSSDSNSIDTNLSESPQVNSNAESGSSDSQNEIKLVGVVQSVSFAQKRFTLSTGVEIRPGQNTRFTDDDDFQLSQSEFFKRLKSGVTRVEVEWRNSSSYDQAPYKIELDG